MISVFWRNKPAVLAGFLILVFGLAFWRTQAVLENDNSPVSRFNNQGKVLVRGLIIDEPERRSGNQKLIVSAESLEAAGFRENISGKILVTGRRFPEYRYGDRLEILGALKTPEISDDFDYAAYLAKDDIYSLINYPEIKKIGEAGSPIYRTLFGAKQKIEETIGLILPEPHSSFLAAILLGARKTLPPDLVENFNITGTTHIVALSGFNITIVSSFIIGLLGFFLIRRNIAFWLAVFGIAGFALMTGASPSVVRAALMGILILWAQRESRLYSITNAIVFAGAVMIFVNPKILRYDAGFQLSFLATLGLIYISPIFQKWLQNFRFPQNLKEVFYLTLSAQIATLPFII
ncbi:MAG: ComEC/Rec2 family competence protein, partial [bacterium]|nr:ComEC/Rec2 family competence protein [bacterium]